MKKRNTTNNLSQVRLLSAKEGQTYTGLGKDLFREWAESIGAVVRVGDKRVLFDKTVIDQALDELVGR